MATRKGMLLSGVDDNVVSPLARVALLNVDPDALHSGCHLDLLHVLKLCAHIERLVTHEYVLLCL